MIKILWVFVVLGIIQSGLFIHEAVHIAQSKAPTSLCYEFGSNLIMYVEHDLNAYNNTSFKQYQTQTEFWAELIGEVWIYFFIMLLTAIYFYNKGKQTR